MVTCSASFAVAVGRGANGWAIVMRPTMQWRVGSSSRLGSHSVCQYGESTGPVESVHHARPAISHDALSVTTPNPIPNFRRISQPSFGLLFAYPLGVKKLSSILATEFGVYSELMIHEGGGQVG
jgi:hypothetical protein